jgi:hypothetical protein
MLLVRNPWGKQGWSGDWKSKVSEKTREFFENSNQKVNPNNDNGSFWIPIEEYIKIFDSTKICCQKIIPKNKKEEQITLTKDFSKIKNSSDYEVNYL